MTPSKHEPEYVVVARSADEEAERIELPTNSEDNNTLGLQTLNGAFPALDFLNYIIPNFFRIDTSGTKFYPPSDGWADKVFVVLSQYQQPPESATKNAVKKSDQNAKRRKLMVESDDESLCNSCDSDAIDPMDGRKGVTNEATRNAAKRQQGASKQKRMMGKELVGQSADGTNEQQEGDTSNRIVDLLIMGLPFELTEDQLRVHFESFGKVVHCEIKTQRGHLSNRGFGFIQMGDLESQKRVLKQKHHIIGDRECQVKIPFSKNALSSKIFVGRLRDGITPIELKKHFMEEAQKIDPDSSVTDVYIPRPFRSFAFVTFSTPVVAKELIKMGQVELKDSTVSISSAHSTRPQEAVHSALHHPSPFTPPHPANLPSDESYSSSDIYSTYGPTKWEYEEMAAASKRLTAPTSGIQQNRSAGPMFTGPIHQQLHQQPFNAYQHPPAAAGSQMLNQLETLNLNNIGMPQEVVNAAIKALVAAAASSNIHQHGEPSHRASSSNHLAQQQFVRYQSLSPPQPTSAASTTKPLSPMYSQQLIYRPQNGRGGEGGRRNERGGWR
uniref:RRM domain-containing protein n=2 Tax=Globodera pallida TaxID=36090 RepID=A0A183CNS9_GLOPA